ncbi:MAG TPA: PadR family transcriptional regulator [Ktedonobacterales bacterium]
MAEASEDVRRFLPLTPATFHILLALAAGERHGYGIMQEVASTTEGQMRLGPGTLYRSIKQLLEGGLIAEAGERTDPSLSDERRRYYQLTDLGRRVAQAEAIRLSRLVAQARERKLLEGLGSETRPGWEGL